MHEDVGDLQTATGVVSEDARHRYETALATGLWLGTVDGLDSSCRPSTLRTTTFAARGTGAEEIASQISPWTKTLPSGDKRGSARCRSSPIRPCTPVTTLLRRARRAMLIRNTVISPSGMLTASAVSRCTRISGMGASTSRSPPSVSSTMPPVVSTPWLTNLASSANKAKAHDNQDQRRKTHGQKVQRESSQQDENDSHCAGHDCARMVELGVERQALRSPAG